jgi:putative addiction module CopG family antidote
MNVSISASLEEFVQKQIKSGMYNSASEVVRAGLRLLMERQTDLNHKIAIGLKQIENGEYEEMDDKFWKKLESEITSEIKKKKSKK